MIDNTPPLRPYMPPKRRARAVGDYAYYGAGAALFLCLFVGCVFLSAELYQARIKQSVLNRGYVSKIETFSDRVDDLESQLADSETARLGHSKKLEDLESIIAAQAQSTGELQLKYQKSAEKITSLLNEFDQAFDPQKQDIVLRPDPEDG